MKSLFVLGGILSLNLCKSITQEISLNFSDHRSDFCTIYQLVEKNELSLENSLRGLTIKAAVRDQIEVHNPEVSVKILESLAKHAQFQVNYFVTGWPEGNQTFTNLVEKQASSYDLACSFYDRLPSRLRLGLIFADWYEGDTIMIRRKRKSKPKFNFWAFAMPFTPQLWILTLFVVILTGAVYYLLDFLKSKAIKEDTDTSFFGSVFFSFHAFTGNCNYSAKSHASQILTVSMCFLYLVLISTYTANLASFFIIENAQDMPINDIGDVIANNLNLCAVKGYPVTERLKKIYVNLKLVEVEKYETLVLTSVSEGVCNVGLVSVEAWKTLSRDDIYNKNCDLEWVGRRVNKVQSGFALKDSAQHCTSLLLNALNLHLSIMEEEGQLEEIWETYRKSQTSDTCVASSSEDDSNEAQLSIKEMGGAFAFHAFLILLSICLASYEYYFHPKDVKTHVKSELFREFEGALRKTVSSFGSTCFVNEAKDFEDEPSQTQSSKSITISEEQSSTLPPEDLNQLLLQKVIALSSKIDYNTDITIRNEALFNRKLELLDEKYKKNLGR